MTADIADRARPGAGGARELGDGGREASARGWGVRVGRGEGGAAMPPPASMRGIVATFRAGGGAQPPRRRATAPISAGLGRGRARAGSRAGTRHHRCDTKTPPLSSTHRLTALGRAVATGGRRDGRARARGGGGDGSGWPHEASAGIQRALRRGAARGRGLWRETESARADTAARAPPESRDSGDRIQIACAAATVAEGRRGEAPRGESPTPSPPFTLTPPPPPAATAPPPPARTRRA